MSPGGPRPVICADGSPKIVRTGFDSDLGGVADSFGCKRCSLRAFACDQRIGGHGGVVSYEVAVGGRGPLLRHCAFEAVEYVFLGRIRRRLHLARV